MKPILIDNAFEAWAAAIHFCDDIKDGKATLQYQKNFVSSLHNAVELFMKQMMLNNNEHDVAEFRKIKSKTDAKLLLDYFESTDLNRFFESLTDDKISKFRTIKFERLISSHKNIFGQSLVEGESLEKELRLLQRLRNNETHFMIRQGSFLSEDDFRVLHNFMVRFYKIMKTWSPINGDYELCILPYWGDPEGAENVYEFERKLLENFSYETAVRNSKLAKDILDLLKNDYLCGAPEFSSYSIAKDLAEEYSWISAQFDEIWAIVYMMQLFKIIDTEDIFDDEQGLVYHTISVNL